MCKYLIMHFLLITVSGLKKDRIRAAHKAISNVSCVKFHEKRANDMYYLNYFTGGGYVFFYYSTQWTHHGQTT